MKEILKKVEVIASNCAKQLEMGIVSVEYVREFGMKILRIIARKDPAMTIDDSSDLNKLISDELDKYDLIDEEYYLEVSSEGIEKELRTNLEIKNAVGEYICIKGYEKIDGKKELYGDLISFDNDTIVILIDDKGRKKEIVVEMKKVAKVRLAVKF